MKRRDVVFGAVVFIAVPLVSARASSAQDSPVTGARVTVVEQKKRGLEITLENLRDTPLVAWELRVVIPGSSEPAVSQLSDFVAYPAENGPVPPGARRAVRYSLSDFPEGSTAVVTLAVFADGYFEGRPESVDKLRQRRKERADDLRDWAEVISQMPRSSRGIILGRYRGNGRSWSDTPGRGAGHPAVDSSRRGPARFRRDCRVCDVRGPEVRRARCGP